MNGEQATSSAIKQEPRQQEGGHQPRETLGWKGNGDQGNQKNDYRENLLNKLHAGVDNTSRSRGRGRGSARVAATKSKNSGRGTRGAEDSVRGTEEAPHGVSAQPKVTASESAGGAETQSSDRSASMRNSVRDNEVGDAGTVFSQLCATAGKWHTRSDLLSPEGCATCLEVPGFACMATFVSSFFTHPRLLAYVSLIDLLSIFEILGIVPLEVWRYGALAVDCARCFFLRRFAMVIVVWV